MAWRHDICDVAWELIKDLVSPEQTPDRPRSEDSPGVPGAFYGKALRDGCRCISVFVNGAMTVRSTGNWSVDIFDQIGKN